MKWLSALAAAAVLAASGADMPAVEARLTLSSRVPKNMTVKKCRVMCQRFGMKALGAKFKGMHPTQCMDECPKAFPETASLLQTAPAATIKKLKVKAPTPKKDAIVKK